MSLSGQTEGHQITIVGRAQMSVSGVSDVTCFNEETVMLDTCEGALTITGEGLHIARLSLEEGEVRLDGRISAIEYADRPLAAKGGWLSRVFR